MVAAGCGSGTAKVQGKVTYKGQPLGQGTVGIISMDGKRTELAEIDANGNYEFVRAPVGEVKCTVVVPPAPGTGTKTVSIAASGVEPKDKAAMAAVPNPESLHQPKGKHVPIPTKYADPEKSGLKYTITSGQNTINIELTD
jgi:hypothetical protein